MIVFPILRSKILTMSRSFGLFLALALAHKAFGYPTSQPNGTELPVINLGYVSLEVSVASNQLTVQELHQALSYNMKSDVYQFSNIRDAQPPIGQLRFQALVVPKTNRKAFKPAQRIEPAPREFQTGNLEHSSPSASSPMVCPLHFRLGKPLLRIPPQFLQTLTRM